MLSTLLNIEFQWWWMCFVFPIMPLLYLYNKKKQNDQSQNESISLPFANNIDHDTNNITSNFNWIDFAIKLIIWTLLIIAMMRPQIPLDAFQEPKTGRDLFMVIDISGSMSNRDMELYNRRVTRMDAVKAIASDFLKQREGDRVGLVFFGLNVATQAPLTYDIKTTAQFIENVNYSELDYPLGSREITSGTSIGDALASTIDNLIDEEIENKVIILLTDGIDQTSTRDPKEMAILANKLGIKIYTIGVNPGRSGLDESLLEDIAKTTNAKYYRARNTYQLQQIYKDIDNLEPNEILSQPINPKKDLFFIFFAISLLIIFFIFSFNLTKDLFNKRELK